MTATSEFLNYCMPSLRGAVPELVMEKVIATLIDFCEETSVWQVDIDPITVSPGLNEYDLESPVDGARVIKVISLAAGRPLEPMTPDQAVAKYGDWRSTDTTHRSNPRFYVQSAPTVLTLVPCPVAALDHPITGRVSLKPLRSATTIDDDLFEDWVDMIAAGVKATMQADVDKPYSNLKAAQINAGIYATGVSKARRKAFMGNTRAILQVQMRSL